MNSDVQKFEQIICEDQTLQQRKGKDKNQHIHLKEQNEDYISNVDKMDKMGEDVLKMYGKLQNNDDLETKLEIYHSYEIIDTKGQGAYGIVDVAKDKEFEENELMAIKQIGKAFEHEIFAKRTLQELGLLKLLNHKNIINIAAIILLKSREQFEDVHAGSEMMNTDLISIIKREQYSKGNTTNSSSISC